MDHPFQTKRHQLRATTTAKSLLDDVRTLLRASDADLRHITRRCDDDVADDEVRACATRHASSLGRLLQRAVAECSAASVATDDLATHENEWIALVSTGKRPRAMNALLSQLASTSETLSEQEKGLRAFEHDTGSSSDSEYSDSDTQSSSDEEKDGRPSRRAPDDDEVTDETDDEDDEDDEV